jgi:hypothetical protein
MAVLDTAEANRIWEAVVGKTTYPATTAPLRQRLYTVVGTDSATGTEVTGGSYASQAVTTWNAAASRAISNNTGTSFTGMPAVGGGGVVATEFWDSAGTPVRKMWGLLATAKVVAAGDTVSFAGGTPGAIVATFG